MVQLTPAFTVLFCVVSLAVDTSSVGAVPLPMKQTAFRIQGRDVASSKPAAFQGYRKESQQVLGSFTAATTVRGSSLASRQVAEVKRSLQARSFSIADTEEVEDADKSFSGATAPDPPSTGWIVKDGSKEEVTKDKSLAAAEDPDEAKTRLDDTDTGEDSNWQTGLQYQLAPSSSSSVASPQPTPHSCGSSSKAGSRLQSFENGSDDEAVSSGPTFDDGMYHPPPVVGQAPSTSSSTPGTIFRASAGDPLLGADDEATIFRRSIYHPHHHDEKTQGQEKHRMGAQESATKSKAAKKNPVHSKTKTQRKEQKERRSMIVTGNGVDIELDDSDIRYGRYESGPGPLISLNVRDDHDHDHIHLHTNYDGDLLDGYFGKGDRYERDHYHNDDHDHDRDHIHEHIHRRLSTASDTTPVVGQMGVLQSLEGPLGQAGVSQLIANIVLAPLAAGAGGGAVSYQSSALASPLDSPTNASDDSTTPTKGGDAYLLAPSSSTDGVKLQMVEMSPSRFQSNESNWKHVQFQATLTNVHNEPHLYCAMVRPPSSLRMELCDDTVQMNSTQVADDGASRSFLYDSSTGEVVPFKPNAHQYKASEDTPDATDDQQQAVAESRSKRETIGAAKLKMKPEGPEVVKLVFFTNQSKVSPEDVTSTSTEANALTPPDSTTEGGEPPLLDADQMNTPSS